MIWFAIIVVTFLTMVGVTLREQIYRAGSFRLFLRLRRGFSEIALFSALYTGAAALASMLLILLLTVSGVGTSTVSTRHELVSMQDGQGIHGSFFLGTGSVDGRPQFTYYQGSGNGAVLRSADASDARVIQDGGSYVITSCNKIAPILAPFGCLRTIDSLEFHVPEGSVVTNFTLDAK